MTEVKMIECPRDAWQGIQMQIPAAIKVQYLRALIGAGFKHIDAVSFVSPKAVPQMSDSEEVLKELDPPDDVEIIGIVVNEKGAQRAIETQAVRTLGFPYSISETFLRKNQNQSAEDALEELEKIQKKADDAGLDVVVYISMAFGNPYGDPWSLDEVVELLRALWGGVMVEHHGLHYDFDRLQLSPVPLAPIPIFGGGHSPLAHYDFLTIQAAMPSRIAERS